MRDDDCEEKDWALARWLWRYNVGLLFVPMIESKPRPDVGARVDPVMAYRWRSYHAARKYQRAHPELAGYMVVNLTRIFKASEALDDERIRTLG